MTKTSKYIEEEDGTTHTGLKPNKKRSYCTFKTAKKYWSHSRGRKLSRVTHRLFVNDPRTHDATARRGGFLSVVDISCVCVCVCVYFFPLYPLSVRPAHLYYVVLCNPPPILALWITSPLDHSRYIVLVDLIEQLRYIVCMCERFVTARSMPAAQEENQVSAECHGGVDTQDGLVRPNETRAWRSEARHTAPPAWKQNRTGVESSRKGRKNGARSSGD